MRRNIYLAALAAIAVGIGGSAAAQSSPGPDGTWLIRGATVVTGTGQSLPNTSVLIRNGRIAQIGANISAPDAQVIDATGKFVYPGMVDAYTPIGLVEIGGIAPMTLRSEMGQYNPHIRAVVALNLDSEFLGVTRMSGVTSVISAPSGGIISGQAAFINTAGWTWEDIAVRQNAAYILNLPAGAAGGGRGGGGGGGRGGGGGGGGNGADRALGAGPTLGMDIHEVMRAAQQYDARRSSGSAAVDLVFEAMRPLVRGEVPAIISASTEGGIRQAIEFADMYGIKIIIQGGGQAYRVRELLAQKNVPVILGSLQSTPGANAPYDELYAQPGLLHEAGVKFAFSTGSGSSARHVPFNASLAVAYGLPKDAAMKALTIWPAEIFGVADQIGSIEVGKMANLFIADGDALDLRTQIGEVFIKGRLTPADDRHSRLYQKYNSRPKGSGGGGN